MSFLLICNILPATTAVTKPKYALDESDVEGWWIYYENGISISIGSVSMTSWYQTWMDNETWSTANAAFCLMIMDMGDLIDYSEIWDDLVLEFAGFSPEGREIPGFEEAVIYNISEVWYGLGYNGTRLLWVLGTDNQGIPELPTFPTKMKTPTNGTGTEEDVETLMIAQGLIIGLGTGIPGFEALPLLIPLAILISIVIILRKDQIYLIQPT